MKLSKNLFAFLALSIPFTSIAKDYYLNENETVSELLYNRLGLVGIYGSGRYLEQVLKENNLTQDTAKHLKKGSLVRVPDFGQIEPEAPKAVVEKPKAEKVKNLPEPKVVILSNDPYQKEFSLVGKLHLDHLSGENDEADFELTFFIPEVGANYTIQNSKNIFRGYLGAGFTKVQEESTNSGKTSFILPTLSLHALRRISNINLGLKARYESQMFFVIAEDGKSYAIKSPFLYAFGPRIEWGEKLNVYGGLNYTPSQQVTSGTDTKGILDYELGVNALMWPKTRLGLGAQYADRNSDNNDSKLIRLILSGDYVF